MSDQPADPLRTALAAAELTAEQVADHVGVDAKTVRRWLQGRVPYPRHRTTLAELLELSQTELWPDLPATATTPSQTGAPPPAGATDPVTGFPSQADPNAPTPFVVMASATRQLDVSQSFLPVASNGRARDANGERTHQLLTDAARAGVQVRLLVNRTDQLPPPDARYAVRGGSVRHPLIRADDRLLIIIQGFIPRDTPWPVLDIHRHINGGLFDRIMASHQHDWDAADPLTPPPDQPLTKADPRPIASAPPTSPERPGAPPRRWPRHQA